MSHTPGPWATLSGDDHDFSVDHDGQCDGLLQGVVASGYKVIGNPEMDEMAIIVVDMNERNCWDDALLAANARLVSAAPAMLDQLEKALDMLETFDGTAATCANIRKVIASARQDNRHG